MAAKRPVAGPVAAKVALALCAEVPDLDGDGKALASALASKGVSAGAAVWDDPSVEWDDFDLVVVRGTWDYVWRRGEFLAWANQVRRIANPADILTWNTDKTYLGELAAAGVPVIPSQFFRPGDSLGPGELPEGEVVVKPSVSAGAYDTSLYGPGDTEAAADHVRALQQQGRTALVQPYRAKVDQEAETGLVYLGGDFSHAIRKEAMLRADPVNIPGLYREMVVTSRTATDLELETADAILDAVPGGRERLLYARVDLVPGPSGPELIELEVTEPALYLDLDLAEAAVDRFASAIVERLGD